MSSNSENIPVHSLENILKKIIPELAIGRQWAQNEIESAIKDLSFFHDGLTLENNDPSYIFRRRLAVEYLKEASGESKASKKNLKKLIKDVKDKLAEKNCFIENQVDANHVDEACNNIRENKDWRNKRQVLGYVTVISQRQSKIFVKPVNGERELEVAMHEIIRIGYDFIKPGDKVEVTVNVTKEGQQKIGRNLTILKLCTSEHSSDVKNRFIEGLKNDLLSEKYDALTVCLILERCKGIWDYIKNDDSLKEMTDNVKNILRLSAFLSEKLSMGTGTACQTFLEDLSSSFFFVNALPVFIKASIQDPSFSEGICDIETLLKLMVKFSASSSKRVFKVAHCLADALIDQSQDTNGAPGVHTNCHRGTQLLANLGESLTKHIPGSQEKDTAHLTWDELPVILTQKEIFSEHDISGLQAIKFEEPYKSKEEYLETNYRLLREECFWNLYCGIRTFCNNPKEHDWRKMRMFRITLHDLFITADISIKLKYEIYGEPCEEDSVQEKRNILTENLMCISLDKKFETPIWATVATVPEKMRQMDSNEKIVYVQLCSQRNKLMDAQVLLKLQELTQTGDYALMAECPIYYQAFAPCMERLIEAKTSDLPFEEEIVFCKKSEPPEYTTDDKQKCNDWSIIFEIQQPFDSVQDQRSPVETFKLLMESQAKSELDNTQLKAIQRFLENRVALIQGPPGTGKSFLGAKILQLMLSMEIQKRYKGPILVMTYKNVALDHFLKTCLEYCPNIVRIGNSDQLKEINLKNVCKKENMRGELFNKNKQVMANMKTFRSKLRTAFSNLINHACFTLKSFLQGAQKCHIYSLICGSSDVNQCSKEKAEELLSHWKEDFGWEADSSACSVELRDLVKKCLKEWLPMEKLRSSPERKTKHEASRRHSSKSCPEDKSFDENREDDQVLDSKVVMNERMQDADEEDEELLEEANKIQERSGDGISVPLAIDFMDNKEEKRTLQDVSTDLHKLSEEARVDFVYALQYKVIKRSVEEFTKSAEEYDKNLKIYQEIWQQHTVNTLKEYDVIGMTISGAAKRLRLINEIKPCAVIVEEAAEILEGQLISIIPPTVKHLVMLGDQKQLKPSVSCYKLKIDKKFDCSMFERLINNKLDYQQLGRQCRMREDIAQLLCELKIYTNLATNEEKTSANEPPKCVGESMFFWNHTDPESEIPGTTSKYNNVEIRKITEVAKHLLKNDCPPEDITVLSPYRGQVEQMQMSFNKASRDCDSSYTIQMKNIKITTVDSFQGEENKIILLSLVRSNSKMKIGFSSVKNRICVAVSRAKCAFYIFGNSTVYENSENWKAIIKLLERKKLVGSEFPFKYNEEDVLDRTPLSEREIVRLLNAGVINYWQELAGLLNMPRSEIDNISLSNNRFPEEKYKANEMLNLYNKNCDFSRATLEKYLEEVKLLTLKGKVTAGTLRK